MFLVGAGPGDPDLITVKGMRCLRQADVVLHDRLVDRRLLDEVRPDAMIIDVGKRKGTEDAQQARIDELMVKFANEGLIVCRLKGGDPFVFGRLSEEVRALGDAGLDFEIVPGVSSVTAVPGAAGVFLTERGVSHGFMVLAAPQSLPFDSQEWAAARTLLMAGGSVVVMMGLARTPKIRVAASEWMPGRSAGGSNFSRHVEDRNPVSGLLKTSRNKQANEISRHPLAWTRCRTKRTQIEPRSGDILPDPGFGRGTCVPTPTLAKAEEDVSASKFPLLDRGKTRAIVFDRERRGGR